MHRFEITEFQRLPGWAPQAGEVSLRVVDPTPRLIEIRHTRIYHRGSGRLALGPPLSGPAAGTAGIAVSASPTRPPARMQRRRSSSSFELPVPLSPAGAGHDDPG